MAEETGTPAETEAPPKSLSLLAQERFGSAYYGEVKQPETAEQPEEAREEEETTEEATEQAESGEESDTETAEGAEEETETAEESESESEEEHISTLDELAEYMRESQGVELDPEWLENLKVAGKVNGQEVQYTLKELKDSAQKVQAADEYLETAKERTKKQTQELSEKSEKLNEYFNVAAELIHDQEQQIERDSQAVDWQRLREDDPAEFSAKKAEFEERKRALETKKGQASQKYQQWLQEQQQEQQRVFAEQVQAEQQALLEKLPEWKDDSKAKQEKTALSEYLVNQGFTKEEVGSAADHRMIILARKAMLYDKQAKSGETAKKKLKTIPKKVMKPTAPKSSQQTSQDELNKKRAQLKKTGDINTAFELLKSRRNG